MSNNSHLLSKLAQVADTDTRLLFAHVHIFSYFNFASSLWDLASEAVLKLLQTLYRRVAKIILKGVYISTDEKLRKLNILILEKRCLFNEVCIKLNRIKPYHTFLRFLKKATNRYGSLNFMLPKSLIRHLQNKICFLWSSDLEPTFPSSQKLLYAFKF